MVVVPDWSHPIYLAWDMDHVAIDDGWIYAEARNGLGAPHPTNHSHLLVNGFRIELCCGGCDAAGVLQHGSVLIPIKKGDQFKAENGSVTKLAFLSIRYNSEFTNGLSFSQTPGRAITRILRSRKKLGSRIPAGSGQTHSLSAPHFARRALRRWTAVAMIENIIAPAVLEC
jgi:hypothetical protein